MCGGNRTGYRWGVRQAKGVWVLDRQQLPWERDGRALGNPRGQDGAKFKAGNWSLVWPCHGLLCEVVSSPTGEVRKEPVTGASEHQEVSILAPGSACSNPVSEAPVWVGARPPLEGCRAASPGYLAGGYVQVRCLQTPRQGHPAQQGQGSAGAVPPAGWDLPGPEWGDGPGRAALPARRRRGVRQGEAFRPARRGRGDCSSWSQTRSRRRARWVRAPLRLKAPRAGGQAA